MLFQNSREILYKSFSNVLKFNCKFKHGNTFKFTGSSYSQFLSKECHFEKEVYSDLDEFSGGEKRFFNGGSEIHVVVLSITTTPTLFNLHVYSFTVQYYDLMRLANMCDQKRSEIMRYNREPLDPNRSGKNYSSGFKVYNIGVPRCS
ncbi:hypothetical protein BpHYR1_006201 [Brachionus plicatilis]|uniref:Uncharacterized protein n=1 Tax=Brachionus plicatilis TaxID=10195 RepID=A0A3M7R4Q2_BRAPC|nr:hypothetical protein BpHYR1_006201 [Brachionus plicatilis]